MKMKMMVVNSYPILISISMMNMFLSLNLMIMMKNYEFLMVNLLMNVMILMKWWKKLEKESLGGIFMKLIKESMKFSFMMFIFSEVMIFSCMFWMFFHSSISPNTELGMKWPPMSFCSSINPLSIPLSMSMILLMSSFSITLSHHLALKKILKESMMSLKKTFLMGFLFVIFQVIEYTHSNNKILMSFNDSVYSSSFFSITCLHGTHVIGGSTFLMNSKKIFKKNSLKNMINFEMSIWYWHFVDLVWIFVFSFIYWWNMFL